jgi:cytoskeletal protein CcmA (bactofilin family)
MNAPVEITALLGRGTRFEGKLTFEGCVRIDGAFVGEIRSHDTLILGEGADVHAELDVGTLIVRGGTFQGTIRARNGVEMYAPGRVVGNIWSPQISMERGVIFQGQTRMDTVTDPPFDAPLGAGA